MTWFLLDMAGNNLCGFVAFFPNFIVLGFVLLFYSISSINNLRVVCFYVLQLSRNISTTETVRVESSRDSDDSSFLSDEDATAAIVDQNELLKKQVASLKQENKDLNEQA